jgi:hypothetical protein
MLEYTSTTERRASGNMGTFFVHSLLLLLIMAIDCAMGADKTCERLDFNDQNNTKMMPCTGKYKYFLTKEYTANGTFKPFRPTSKYYLSVDGKNGYYCAETVDIFYVMPKFTDFRIIYQLTAKYASVTVKVLDADDKLNLVEEWTIFLETSDWSLFKEEASRTVRNAKVQIVALMNDKNDLAMEYLTVYNSVVATQDKKCKDLDEHFNPPGTTEAPSTTTESTSSSTTTTEKPTTSTTSSTTSSTSSTTTKTSPSTTTTASTTTKKTRTTTKTSPPTTTTESSTSSTTTTTESSTTTEKTTRSSTTKSTTKASTTIPSTSTTASSTRTTTVR